MASSACSRVILSFTRRCRSDVARNTCSLGAAAGFRASMAAVTSSFLARASAAIGTLRTSWATFLTASRSPCDAIGKPASITSTFMPASSRATRKLGDSSRQPLFVRGARPVRLTDAGTLLKDYAERLINLRDEVKKGLSELEGLKRGELSMGVNESSIHALLPALAKFREKHPGVQVRVHRMLSRDIPHEVLNYRLDLGAISFVPRDAQLLATEIRKDELTLVVHPKHVPANNRDVYVA